MPKMALIKWLLFLVMIARIEGYFIRKSRNSSISEEILKTILESCHEHNSFPNPVFVFGNFDKSIDGVSIIRINNFSSVNDNQTYKTSKVKASSIVLMEEPPEILSTQLELLKRTKLWNNMIPFFIVGNSTASCGVSSSILKALWEMEILNSIYICGKSTDNTSEIYTSNPITNYAPYPWKRIEEVDNFNVFHQNFDANISCMHLAYDKTKILNGYNIVLVHWRTAESSWMPEQNYFETITKFRGIDPKAMQAAIRALNASGRMEVEKGIDAMIKRYIKGTADIMLQSFPMEWHNSFPYLFPHRKSETIAVVKLKAEVSTLGKICRLWSIPVLIAAALALALLFIILTIKRWSFGLALLDLTRLLTYTSIQTDNRHQSFRIYFTTMLIFIVISNGVFQGKIAAFLTTRERSSAAESIHELVKLEYEMYTVPDRLLHTKSSCRKCTLKIVSTHDECIGLVLNSTKTLCLMTKKWYETDYIQLPLDRVRKPLNSQLVSFKSRRNWPLHDRFDRMMMSLVESGLNNFWEMELSSIPKLKRRSMEAEWSSPQYRPVTFIKLYFAFELLAIGLFLATIVLFLELCWAKYRDS